MLVMGLFSMSGSAGMENNGGAKHRLTYLDTIEITRSGENASLSHRGALNCNFGFGITKKIYSYYEYIRRCFFW